MDVVQPQISQFTCTQSGSYVALPSSHTGVAKSVNNLVLLA